MNESEKLLAEQRRTNALLELLCHIHLASFEDEFSAVEYRKKVDRIMGKAESKSHLDYIFEKEGPAA
jgi:hypothetical protein